MPVNVKKELSIEKIFNKVSQIDIYRRYIGDVSPKKMICSPLREDDHTPSFRLYYGNNGDLRFIDYGTGTRGGVFDFVSILHPYLTFGELLEKVWEDLHCRSLPELPVTVSNRVKPKSFPTLLIKKRQPTEDDVKLWKQWGISVDTLNHFKVSPISKFWIDRSLFKCKTLSYSYDLFTEFKIYRPLEERLRFISGGMELQGYKLLPDRGEICVIQKSYKDAMFMHEFGIPSFAPQAESIDVPEQQMESILSRFDRVFIWGDPDTAGISFAERHVEKYGITAVFNNDGTKDITDSYAEHGEYHSYSMIEKLLGI